mmetsp:Transcript_382/g.1407  ORF Transcript_382/g.1407 Transcript_382/m.1407 type:complete len:244 (-) Transcript_382:995-1726(-)
MGLASPRHGGRGCPALRQRVHRGNKPDIRREDRRGQQALLAHRGRGDVPVHRVGSDHDPRAPGPDDRAHALRSAHRVAVHALPGHRRRLQRASSQAEAKAPARHGLHRPLQGVPAQLRRERRGLCRSWGSLRLEISRRVYHRLRHLLCRHHLCGQGPPRRRGRQEGERQDLCHVAGHRQGRHGLHSPPHAQLRRGHLPGFHPALTVQQRAHGRRPFGSRGVPDLSGHQAAHDGVLPAGNQELL